MLAVRRRKEKKARKERKEKRGKNNSLKVYDRKNEQLYYNITIYVDRSLLLL